MGCNCKTNKRIAYLEKNYGVEKDVSVGEDIGFTVSEFFGRVITYIVLVLLLPLMCILLIVKLLSSKKEIDIAKLFRLKKEVQYVREQ